MIPALFQVVHQPSRARAVIQRRNRPTNKDHIALHLAAHEHAGRMIAFRTDAPAKRVQPRYSAVIAWLRWQGAFPQAGHVVKHRTGFGVCRLKVTIPSSLALFDQLLAEGIGLWRNRSSPRNHRRSRFSRRGANATGA